MDTTKVAMKKIPHKYIRMQREEKGTKHIMQSSNCVHQTQKHKQTQTCLKLNKREQRTAQQSFPVFMVNGKSATLNFLFLYLRTKEYLHEVRKFSCNTICFHVKCNRFSASILTNNIDKFDKSIHKPMYKTQNHDSQDEQRQKLYALSNN